MANSKNAVVENYLAQLPADRKDAMKKLRETILKNIPKGFHESFSSGMIAYNVPHALYADGYHCNPDQELPFVSIANQKGFIAIYHMGIYVMPRLLKWFTTEFPKQSERKLDMGKSCIRFKYVDDIPFGLIAELMKKVTLDEWINTYETELRKK